MYNNMDRGLPCPVPFVAIILLEMKSSTCSFVLLLVSSSLTKVMIEVGILLFLRL